MGGLESLEANARIYRILANPEGKECDYSSADCNYPRCCTSVTVEVIDHELCIVSTGTDVSPHVDAALTATEVT
jgi:hypothetical protein